MSRLAFAVLMVALWALTLSLYRWAESPAAVVVVSDEPRV